METEPNDTPNIPFSPTGVRFEPRGAPWVPSLRPKDVFRQLIEDEVRSGRLTRMRRRRIVRYGARLGLSAVEVGQLVDRCRSMMAEEIHTDRLRNFDAEIARPFPVESQRPPSRRYRLGTFFIAWGAILLLYWWVTLQ